MARRRHTSSPPSLPSTTRRSRKSFHNEDLHDYLSTIPDNYHDRQDDNSASDNEPLQRPSTKAMGRQPSKDSFPSRLGKHVTATQFTATSVWPLHPQHWMVNILSEEEDEREPTPPPSRKVFNKGFEWFNPPNKEYLYQRKDSNEDSKQLVPWNAGNQWQYGPFVNDVTGLICGAEYDSQTTLAAVPAMVLGHVQHIAISHLIFVNPFATHVVITFQIHSWEYEEIARIDQAQRNSDPPPAYISAVNESCQGLFSLLTLYIMLSQRLFTLVQEWYTAERPQSLQLTDFESSWLQRSGKWSPSYWPWTGFHAPWTFVR